MRNAVLFFAALAALCLIPAAAFAINLCADVTQDEAVDISDMVYMLDVFRGGGPPLPDGTGDIDYRQGFNLGDLSYFCNYIFAGGGEGGCPPFDEYDVLQTIDTLVLPEGDIPAGTGTIGFPIVLVNKDSVFDYFLPLVVSGLNPANTSVYFVASDLMDNTLVDPTGDLELVITAPSIMPYNHIAPGMNTLGTLEITYNSTPAQSFSVDTTSYESSRFMHHVYGELLAEEIGMFTVIKSAASPYPNMSVEPESLFFSTLTSIPITEPETFTVESDGEIFAWTLDHIEWLDVTPISGISGQTVTVLPQITGLPVGTHYGTIIVSSDDAFGSPKEVVVELKLRQTYPSFDANCDGAFDIDDIVVLIMYIFAEEDPPCDPCAGE
jgi:hypothetical protein